MLFGKKPAGTIAYMGGVMSLPEPFVWSWSQMIQFNSQYMVPDNEYIHYDHATVSYHSFARNVLVDKFKGDWLLMMDTDHQFEPDIAVRMLALMEKHNIDVLSGIYQFKSPPYPPVAFRWNEHEAIETIGNWDRNKKTGQSATEIFQVGSAGGGCLMVRRKVFDAVVKKFKCKPFDIKMPYSEDHSFFWRLHKMGIKAYCAPGIESHHLVYKPIELNDYFKNKNLKIGPRKKVEGFK